MMTGRVITAREQLEMLSPWRRVSAVSFPAFSIRHALITDDLYYGLSGQFTQWANQNGKVNPRDADLPRNRRRGPAGHWPHIEDFLKENYPAAHRGLQYGFEGAQSLLDSEPEPQSKKDTWRKKVPDAWWVQDPYETGPDAHAKYGYDPKEVAAAMLMMHNDTHPGRQEWRGRDTNRLVDIMQKRQRMQREYEQRNINPGGDSFGQFVDQIGPELDNLVTAGLSPWRTAGGILNPHLDWDEPDTSAVVHTHLHPDEVMGYARHDNDWRNLNNMNQLMSHLSDHGMLEPIYIAAGPEHAVIEDGHHRARAAQALGWDKVPVHITDDPYLDDEYETPHGPGLAEYLSGGV